MTKAATSKERVKENTAFNLKQFYCIILAICVVSSVLPELKTVEPDLT